MSRLSSEAIEKLLQAMGPDRAAAGAAYEDLRRRLLRLFRWEGCPAAQDCADEVFGRLAAKLLAGERIANPAASAGGFARLVLKEAPRPPAGDESQAEPTRFERRLAGLDRESREFLLDYYRGAATARVQSRQRLANRLQVPPDSLRDRALRLREKLEGCVETAGDRDA